MRTFRNRSTVLAATTTAVLALALTACGDSETGTKSAGPAASTGATVAAQAPESEKTTDGAQETGTTGSAGTEQETGTTGSAGTKQAAASTESSARTGASGSTGSTSKAAALCTTKDVAITAERQDGPPYTHIVLTAKNTSSKSCRMGGFPQIQFLESHRENVPPVAKSKPAAPVVLAPGAPAYALVRLSNGGVNEENEPVSAFSVMLEGSNGLATVKAPGKGGIAVNPAKWATGYWTYELRNGADDF
ncbi:DUF4232 domain-containing protein [Streptomyces sp. NPDC059452]|uniref:DUF4232 domain-containing protein n=1 Tax=Streptomyces sp. NPDC059452 TaxID=3346835 RepID=UPI0036AE4C1B